MKKPIRTAIIISSIIFSMLSLFSCKSGGKRTQFEKPYPIPPNIPVNVENYRADQYPLHVYWSQTNSERGYVQDRRQKINPPPQFEHFLTAFDHTIFRYKPDYNILKRERDGKGPYLKWLPITENEFSGKYRPDKSAFYDIVSGGDFEGGIGPLMMLYEGGMVRADDLTIVISDLEEQGLNNIKLAASIRNLLLSSPRNAVALIVVKLPFNGVDWKPNPDRRDRMISQNISGTKPLYVVVTGLRDPVAVFMNSFSVMAKRNGVECYIVSTLYPPEIDLISVSEVIIPASATPSDQAKVDRNKRILDDIWDFRNKTVPRHIWNLRDETRTRMFEVFGVKEPLNIRLLQYRTIGGGAKNGHRLWQLNVEFDIPQGLTLQNVEAVIENYRFLAADTSVSPESIPEDGKKKRSQPKQTRITGVWETNDAYMRKDLEISANPIAVEGNRAVVYVVPSDKKKQDQQSPVLYFEVVLRMPVMVPDWVNDFDEKAGGTHGLYTFVEGILGIKPGEKQKALPEGHELLRLPVVLTDIPSRVQR
jgi:hypothetical protein